MAPNKEEDYEVPAGPPSKPKVNRDPEGLTGDQVELVKLLGTHFIQRKNVKAIQGDDGAWMPVRQDSHDTSSPFMPWTMMDFQFHLNGDASYGHYLLDEDNNCKLFAFDIDVIKNSDSNKPDLRKIWLEGDDEDPRKMEIRFQLRLMAEGLCYAIEDLFGDDIKISVCESGSKGLHVYGLYGTMPARVAREAAFGVLDSLAHFTPTKGDNFFRYHDPDLGETSIFDALEVEVFPKQDELNENGLGNLIALPCGIDRRTGRRRNFVRFDGVAQIDGWRTVDPIQELTDNEPWWKGSTEEKGKR